MPFDYPLRLEVQRRLSGILRDISPGNGYVTDLSAAVDSAANCVFRGRLIYGENDPLPMLSLLEVPIPIDQLPPPVDAAQSSGLWEMMIQGFAVDDRANPTDPAHVLMADVKKRLALEKKKTDWNKPEQGILGLGRYVTGMYIGPGVVRPPDEISAKAYFWLTITLDLAEDLDDPYAVEA
jgi:hypothetical protein